MEDFAAAFPGADVRPDRYVIDGPVFTTGGASPTFDLMLHLVRSRLGMAVALDVASVFIYDQARAATDAQPLVSLGRLDGYDPRLAQAIRLMEAHVDQPLTIAAIARRAGVTPRTLEMHLPQIDRRDAGRLLSQAAAQRGAAAGRRHAGAHGRHRRAHRLLVGRVVLARLFACVRPSADPHARGGDVAPLLRPLLRTVARSGWGSVEASRMATSGGAIACPAPIRLRSRRPSAKGEGTGATRSG